MGMTCTRCDWSGFLNLSQLIDEKDYPPEASAEQILSYIKTKEGHDVSVCDCCGNKEYWYGTPGEHYNNDHSGHNGPYAYNGGLCECN